jgi:uroporphyrinogen III methyltransferase/synthase
VSGRVSLVGAGPGDPALLTLGGLHALREADVVLYDALVSPAVLELASSGAERLYVGKRGSDHALPQREIEARMIAFAREGKRVVRLKGGDPYVFGRGAEEAQALHAAGIAFDVVPGITSAIAAPAYAGIPLTHRAHASWVTIATGHEDPSKPQTAMNWRALAAAPSLVVLMGAERLESIACSLVEHGADAARPAAVVQDGTRPWQRCVTGTLGSIAADAAQAGVEPPAVLVVGDVVTLRDELRWFERGALFGKRVLVTRPHAQAQSFARALLARGAEPIVAPTIAIVPPDDPKPLARAVERVGDYDWIAFLSRNAVDAFFEGLRALARDARAIGTVHVAAIGTKTAQALREHGVRADLVSGRATSEDVVQDLLAAVPQRGRVLIFGAQEGRDVVRSVLIEHGRAAEGIAAYKTVETSDADFAEKVARCDVLTFTSASTVRSFARLLGGDAAAVSATRGKTVACIGPVTADEARDIGLHVDVVPDAFTTDALVAALEAHGASAA